MPSIANQDFKIYGKLSDTEGIPAKYCGELYAAFSRINTVTEFAQFVDGYCFNTSGTGICRLLASGGFYFDAEAEQILSLEPGHANPAYYDALWAIQQAVYANSGDILAGDTKFGFNSDGEFGEIGYGAAFVNEDGYIIKGTAADGILSSLYLGEKAEDPENCAVVRLESLLPLVGELPLGTTEIW